MANHKNLKKVIAVSSMAAATMGAGTIVNADNVHQQPVSSQKSSISTKVSTESQSVKSSSRVVLKSSKSSSTKVSSQSSVKKTTSIASSSSKVSTKASSISKANSKKDSAKKSSESSKKVSSQNSNKNAADAVSAIETLQDAANKYQNSSDATTQSYAQEAQQWLSNLGTFMNAQKNGWNSQKEIDNEINALKNDIKSNEDTLNASWFHGNDATKEIIKDQINADKAMLTYLTGNAQETPATKNDAEATSSKKADQKVAAKNTTSAKKSVSKVNKTVSSKSLHETHVVSAATKNDAKNTTSTLPQTGETNNIGVLAGISVLAIAAAGAFLFRKRG